MIPLDHSSVGEIGPDLALLAVRMIILLIVFGPLLVAPLIGAAARGIRSAAGRRMASHRQARSHRR